MNLTNLTLVQRLSLCFATLVALLMLLIALSVKQIDNLRTSLEEMVLQSFPKVVLANNYIDQTNSIARSVRTMLIARDDAEMVKTQNQQIRDAEKTADELQAKLEQAVITEQGRQILQGLQSSEKGFRAGVAEYQRLFDNGLYERAQSYLLSNLRTAQYENLNDITALIDYESKLVDQQGVQTKEDAHSTIQLLLAIGALSTLLACLLAFLLIRSVKRQLGADPKELASITTSIAEGRLDLDLPPVVIENSVMAAVKSMLASLQKSAVAARDNARVKSALDNVSANVMIADNERTIIYTNKTVQSMLQTAESDIRKALPQFDASKLMGSNIDQFHKNPEHQKGMLARLNSTHTAQIEVGGRIFRLTVNPVFGANGERLGSVVEWLDRTLEVAVEDEVGQLVKAASEGDFTQRISQAGKQGFFLNLANGLNQLVETADKGLKDVARVLGALAEGDLTQRIETDYQGTFGQLKDYSNETTQSLSRMLGQISEATDTIYTAASEIAAGNSDLSSRTEEQASSLEETASSMEELTSTVKLNAENARQANSLAVNASEVATTGGNVVQQVVQTMSSINDSARKIADIIGVIDGIAFQTNILALNAAVEAARAGDQGRGFAVVAAEVRTLAQRSAAAAKEIKTLISDSVDKVDNGNTLVAQAGQTMTEIVVAIKRVTDIMAEIAAASAEQSSGIEEINIAVSQMDEMTQQNAALVEQAAAAAEAMQDQATTLNQSVAVFRFDQTSKPQSANATPRNPVAPARPAAKVPVTKLKSLPPTKKVKEDEWEEF
jgi:methyl-accepting chemotaxis protein